MKLVRQYLVAQGVIALAMISGISPAQTVIAHRGAFHDRTIGNDIPENTVASVNRAYSLGMSGVELDLRLSSDGDVMVTHDLISNRTTVFDGQGGGMDPIQIYNGLQSPAAINISSHTSSFWSEQALKTYSGGGVQTSGPYRMADLTTTLNDIRGLFGNGFRVILDIQDPTVFSKAAAIVSQLGVQKNVYLKFFVVRAVFNNLTYDGANTCYTYMTENHLEDPSLQIIPQINDGEIDIIENDNAGIKIWGTTLTIPEYLNCWSNARLQHTNVAYMPIVSASVPENSPTAVAGATAALNWAKSNGRSTMSIVPNPDVGISNNGSASGGCTSYSFQAALTSAKLFNLSARNSKASFVSENKPTYVIYDVMSDLQTHSYAVDYGTYVQEQCFPN